MYSDEAPVVCQMKDKELASMVMKQTQENSDENDSNSKVTQEKMHKNGKSIP